MKEEENQNAQEAELPAPSCSHGITAEELKDLLHHIGEATQMLDDNYPRWNEEGRRHAVRMATIAVKDAYKLGSYYLMRMKSANVEGRDGAAVP